jgi:hypothetical protein
MEGSMFNALKSPFQRYERVCYKGIEETVLLKYKRLCKEIEWAVSRKYEGMFEKKCRQKEVLWKWTVFFLHCLFGFAGHKF